MNKLMTGLKRKMKIDKSLVIIFLFLVAISPISIVLFVGEIDLELSIAELISITVGVVGAFLLWYELSSSANVNQAEFIVNLNQLFVNNESYKELYLALDNYDFESKPDLDISRADISNYLTFFEAMYILVEKKVIKFEIFDDLFAYRFFIAIHNPYIQKVKLIANPENFKNIYELEQSWIRYRKKHNLQIFHSECCLPYIEIK